MFVRFHRTKFVRKLCGKVHDGATSILSNFSIIDSKGNPIPVARTDRERMRQHYILVAKGET
jgi:hypothetical protein